MAVRPPAKPALSRRRAMGLIGAGAGLAACAPQNSQVAEPSVQAPEAQPEDSSPGICWRSLAALPFAVQEIYPAPHRNRIHIAGGLLGEGGRVVGVSDRHIAYDPYTAAAEPLGTLPAPRHHPQLVSAGGRLVCLGGFLTTEAAVNWIMTGETLLYNDETGTWTPLASASEPHAESVAAVIDNHVHIIGGRRNTGDSNLGYGDHTDSVSHLVFDPSRDSWERAAPALTPRNSAAGALINENWHVVGGRSLSDGPMDVHEIYDPGEDRWRVAAPLPKDVGAGGNAAGSLDGKLYVFGGEYRGGVHAEVCRYDPATDSWEIVGKMLTPRHGLGGVTLGDAIYAVGGAIRPSGDGTSEAIERLGADCD